jgi:hypothetical protein
MKKNATTAYENGITWKMERPATRASRHSPIRAGADKRARYKYMRGNLMPNAHDIS